MYVRFDDLTPGNEHSFEMSGLVEVVVANTVEDVRPALDRIDRLCRGGLWAAGFVTYEAAPGLDPALPVRTPDPRLPLVWFAVYRSRKAAVSMGQRSGPPPAYHISSWRTGMDRTAHAEAIDEIHGAIADGDSYQVNFTFQLDAAFAGDPYALYRDVAMAQRGGYGAYLDTGPIVIASASPEMFFELEGGVVSARPMKGTIGRGRWIEEDLEQGRALAASEKDQAENLMIVDLVRNDLGRIAEFGTVSVDALFDLERFETVWHLTSSVTGRPRRDVQLGDVFAALFPCGSITGAPKQKTMEIISELEPVPRGVYCGAIGFVGPGTQADGSAGIEAKFNVAIRTITIDCEEGSARYGVGGGITWDSHSDDEYEEARVKALVLGGHRPQFSLLETMRFEPGSGVLYLDRHLRRLEGSSRYFAYPFVEKSIRANVRRAVADLVAPHRIRLLLDRSGAIRVEVFPEESAFSTQTDGAVAGSYIVDDVPVASDDVFLHHKTTHRAVYEDRLTRHPAADDVLMVNQRGELTEFTLGNVVVEIDGVWWTPPRDSGLLGGTHREVLLEAMEIRERVLEVADLEAATGVALLNSVRGWISMERLPRDESVSYSPRDV